MSTWQYYKIQCIKLVDIKITILRCTVSKISKKCYRKVNKRNNGVQVLRLVNKSMLVIQHDGMMTPTFVFWFSPFGCTISKVFLVIPKRYTIPRRQIGLPTDVCAVASGVCASSVLNWFLVVLAHRIFGVVPRLLENFWSGPQTFVKLCTPCQ